MNERTPYQIKRSLTPLQIECLHKLQGSQREFNSLLRRGLIRNFPDIRRTPLGTQVLFATTDEVRP